MISQFVGSAVFILGAQDPEMNRIEAVLRSVGAYVLYAAFRGADGTVARVHGGVAYKATLLMDGEAVVEPSEVDGLMGYADEVPYDDRDGFTPVWVECAVQGGDRSTYSIILDHHNPGDPGYGGAPEAYWESSSLGQLWRLLLSHGMDAVDAMQLFGEDAKLLAASDHCPAHAYQGRCPGVDVPALKAMRRHNAATFQKKSFEDFDREVDAAVQALLECPVARLGELEYRIAFDPIPQLNHAQLEAGVPVQYTMPGNARDPRTKVGLLGGSPELIRMWMDEKSITMDGVYGDPERGYAGCYVPAR